MRVDWGIVLLGLIGGIVLLGLIGAIVVWYIFRDHIIGGVAGLIIVIVCSRE